MTIHIKKNGQQHQPLTIDKVNVRPKTPRPIVRNYHRAADLKMSGILFFAPFVEAIKGGDLIVSGLLSLVLLSGVLAVASRGRTLTVALLLR